MKKIICLFIYFLSPLPIILSLYGSNPLRYGNVGGLIPMVLGATAFSWLCWQFVLSARPRFLDRLFGLDRLYRFHGWMAIVAVLIGIGHKLLEYEGTLATSLGEWALYIFIGVTGLTLLFMVDSKIAKWKIVKSIRGVFQPIPLVRRRNMVLLHNLTILALVMIFVHVLLSSSAREFPLVRGAYILYFTLGAGFYFVHRFYFAKPKKEQRLIIDGVKQESPSMWTVSFVSETGLPLEHLPGQFGFFRFFGKEIETEEHPFSISSGGLKPDGITITVKELGDFTSKIKTLRKGDRAIMDGPYGVFTYLNHKNEKASVLVAGGVGITPILSMLRYMAEKDQERLVLLLWGINSPSDLICKPEIDEIKGKMKNLSVMPVLSGPEEWEGLKGRITADLIFEKMKSTGIEPDSAGMYLCGPPLMMEGIQMDLKKKGEKGIPVHSEKFSL